ncbi:MAG: PhzF family phenazine biosynthesis protein [Sneathiella sp.]
MTDRNNALDFVLMDVFTDCMFGGNQLAIFPNAGELSDRSMYAISRELKVNETVFVTSRVTGGFTVRIFSPHGELSFAGHPLVGAASYLAEQEQSVDGAELKDFILHVPAGPVPVDILSPKGPQKVMLKSPTLPVQLEQNIASSDLAVLLSLNINQFSTDLAAAEAFSSGIPFFCIPLVDPTAVKLAKLDKSVWSRVLQYSEAPHLYIFALGQDGEIVARMFAPGVGIEEDPATGAAAVALGGYLAKHILAPEEVVEFIIHQGLEIGRPSQISLELQMDDVHLKSVRVGGQTMLVGKGTLFDGAR